MYSERSQRGLAAFHSALATTVGLCLLAFSAPAAAAAAQSSPAEACAALVNLQLPGVELDKPEYFGSRDIPADSFTGFTGAAPQPVSAGAHCVVRGTIGRRAGVGGGTYGTRFEMRLPTQWNANFLFQGGGGVDGFIAPAVGVIPCRGSTATPALVRGYAVVSMNGGHPDPTPAFGVDQAARVDFAYASIGKVTGTAKQVIAAYYGKGPQKSVFMGCSNGGREAMIAAQRYPTEFDGVIAGNPGFRLTYASMAEAWDTQQLLRVAPKDASGTPVLSRAFSQHDMDLVSQAVLDACDSADGVKDGLINAWQQCRFDPAVLTCQGAKSEACLSSGQVEAMGRVFDGPRATNGQRLYSDWPYDAGINAPNWRQWKLGRSETATPDALNVVLGGGSLGLYFMTPPAPGFAQTHFNFDQDVARLAETAKLNDATSTFLSSFAQRGGRMIIFQGLSDPVFSANDLLAWYQGVVNASAGGRIDAARRFVRLFMVPGMTHCGDGPALDDFDPLTALERWMDQGEAPDALPAKGKAFPGKEQPLCAYPQQAFFSGRGNANDLSSYQCR